MVVPDRFVLALFFEIKEAFLTNGNASFIII